MASVLHHERRHRTDEDRLGHPVLAVAGDVAHHLAPAGRVADVHGVVEVEVRDYRGQVVGVVVHVVPVAGLGRAAVAPAVGGHDPVALTQEEQELGVPVVGRERPAVTEDDRLPRAPVLVEDLGAIRRGDRSHFKVLLSGRIADAVPAEPGPVCGTLGVAPTVAPRAGRISGDDGPDFIQPPVREAGGVSYPSEDPPGGAPGPLIGVTDPDDPRLDLYRDLNDPARRIALDADQSVFVVEGRLAVERLLTSGYTVRSLLVDDHQVTAAGDLVAATRARGGAGVRRVSCRRWPARWASPSTAAWSRWPTARRPSTPGQLLTDAAGTSTAGETTARRRPRGPQRPREHRGPVPQRRRLRGGRRPPRPDVRRSALPPVDPGVRRTCPPHPVRPVGPVADRAPPGAGRRLRRGRVGTTPEPRAGSLPSASPSSRPGCPAPGHPAVWLSSSAPRDRA